MLRRLLLAAFAAQLAVVLACGDATPSRSTSVPPPPGLSPTAAQPATSEATAQPARPVALVLSITVAERPGRIPDYARSDWGHWIDADRDCQDARQEVLIAESSVAVSFTDERQCRVASGSWTDPYTGDIVGDPGKLDVDHVVPLANAHASGGHAWSRERKTLYANSLVYPGHLVAVTASANRSKGADGPDEWRPPDRTYWCQYATDWVAIKNEWGLTATEREAAALREMLDTCGHSVFLQVTSPDDVPPTPTAATTAPTPTPAVQNPTPAPREATPTPVSSTPGTKYDPDGPDRDCSDFDTWAEAQAFYEAAGGPESDPHKLDSDDNGIACESLSGAPGSTVGAPTVAPSPPATGPTAAPSSPTPPPAPPDTKYDPDGPDRNCSDFDTWAEAQAFYEAAGGPETDRHRLDRDGNGIACESLPGAPS